MTLTCNYDLEQNYDHNRDVRVNVGDDFDAHAPLIIERLQPGAVIRPAPCTHPHPVIWGLKRITRTKGGTISQ